MKEKAKIIKCSKGNEAEHQRLDFCWNCAPWWDYYPICPSHRCKLTKTGYCKSCKKYYDISEVNQK